MRDTGGYAVTLNWTMSNVYGLSPGDVSHSHSTVPGSVGPDSVCEAFPRVLSLQVWWAASDLGWVVGHSYICYAPLLHGNTTILYEVRPAGPAGRTGCGQQVPERPVPSCPVLSLPVHLCLAS